MVHPIHTSMANVDIVAVNHRYTATTSIVLILSKYKVCELIIDILFPDIMPSIVL